MTSRNLTSQKTRPIQSFKNTCQYKTGSLTYERVTDYLVSTNSPFIKGKIQLKQNTLTRKYTFMTDQGITVMGSKGSCSMTWKTPSVFPNDYTFSNLLVPSLLNVTDAAVSKWYSSLNEVKINTAEMFATRKQTVSMIAGRARDIAFLYRSLKRGTNPFQGNRSINPKNASAIWLENSYGWSPLLGDVYTAMEYQKLDPPPLIHKKGKSENVYFEKKLTASAAFPGYIRESKWEIQGKTAVQVRAEITVVDPSVAFARTLGLQDPALLAWELLPYSFVVDWFLPIGPWLEAQNALLGLSVRNPSVTKTRVFFSSCNCTARGSNSYIEDITGYGSAVLNGREKSRVLVLPSLPLPKLKNPISVTHALNAIALLGVQFGRR